MLVCPDQAAASHQSGGGTGREGALESHRCPPHQEGCRGQGSQAEAHGGNRLCSLCCLLQQNSLGDQCSGPSINWQWRLMLSFVDRLATLEAKPAELPPAHACQLERHRRPMPCSVALHLRSLWYILVNTQRDPPWSTNSTAGQSWKGKKAQLDAVHIALDVSV